MRSAYAGEPAHGNGGEQHVLSPHSPIQIIFIAIAGVLFLILPITHPGLAFFPLSTFPPSVVDPMPLSTAPAFLLCVISGSRTE